MFAHLEKELIEKSDFSCSYQSTVREESQSTGQVKARACHSSLIRLAVDESNGKSYPKRDESYGQGIIFYVHCLYDPNFVILLRCLRRAVDKTFVNSPNYCCAPVRLVIWGLSISYKS
jgi:hypothetical protein